VILVTRQLLASTALKNKALCLAASCSIRTCRSVISLCCAKCLDVVRSKDATRVPIAESWAWPAGC
jgi:hypothetical protein